MQRVELTNYEEMNIHCPFCGKPNISDDGISECEHTLFISTDEGGFEYVSPKLEFDKDVDLDEQSMDEFTDGIEYPNSVKFAIYDPAPSFFGAYIGFSAE